MNPFSYGTVVEDEYFYDRKIELEKICSVLTSGNNIVLFAPRRYGKTSLVFKAKEVLEKQKYQCVYIDLLPVFSLESFIEIYLKAIQKSQSNIQGFVQKLSVFIKNIRPKLLFDNAGIPQFGIEFIENKITESTLSEVLDLPEKMSDSNNKIIVIFDEFQEITKLSKYSFENLLRSKIQFQKNVNYLFLGSKTHILSDMFNNKNRAFYNSSYHIQLDTLPLNDTKVFVKNKFKKCNINITDKVIDLLVLKAGNIPYYIQLLASEIWQYSINKYNDINEEIVLKCVDNIIVLKRDYYFELFDKQSNIQKKLLKAVIYDNENIFSSNFMKKYRFNAVSSIQKAANKLIEEGIIEKVANKYLIADPFFLRFIKNYTF